MGGVTHTRSVLKDEPLAGPGTSPHRSPSHQDEEAGALPAADAACFYTPTYSLHRMAQLPYWQQQRLAFVLYFVLSTAALLTSFKYLESLHTVLLFGLGCLAGLLGALASLLHLSKSCCGRVSLETSLQATYYLSLGCAVLSALEAASCTSTLVAITDKWSVALKEIEHFEGLPSVVTLHIIVFTTLAIGASVMLQKASHAFKLLGATNGFIVA